jgi:hypothetical protein
MFIFRVDPVISKTSIDITHRTVDPDREALEELKALRQLGTSREKLVEPYGANGLDRLEALEAVEKAQRSAAAKKALETVATGCTVRAQAKPVSE